MTLAGAIEEGLRERADPVRAEQEARYLKSRREHLGVSVPAIRAVVRSALRAHGELDAAAVTGLAETLWASPVHDLRAAAVEVLEAHASRLVPGDLPLVERMLREAGTWALVDNLAASVAGTVVEGHSADPAVSATLDRWSRDPDFWLRRSALLALLVPLRRGGGDWPRFARYADAMLEEREFFVAKAIGWVLRDTSRARPELVAAWLEPRAARASAVTVREAVKYLSEEDRRAVRAARG